MAIGEFVFQDGLRVPRPGGCHARLTTTLNRRAKRTRDISSICHAVNLVRPAVTVVSCKLQGMRWRKSVRHALSARRYRAGVARVDHDCMCKSLGQATVDHHAG